MHERPVPVAQPSLHHITRGPRLHDSVVRLGEARTQVRHGGLVVPPLFRAPRLGRGQVQHEARLGPVSHTKCRLRGAHALAQVRGAGARRGVCRRYFVARLGHLPLERLEGLVFIADHPGRGLPRLGERGPQVVLDGGRREGVVLDGALGVDHARPQRALRLREPRLGRRRRRAQRGGAGVLPPRLELRTGAELRFRAVPRRQRRLRGLEPRAERALLGVAGGSALLEQLERRRQGALLRRERRRVAPGRLELGLEVAHARVVGRLRGLGRGVVRALQLRDAPLRIRERRLQPRGRRRGLGTVVVAAPRRLREAPVRSGRPGLGRVGARPQLVGPDQDRVGVPRCLHRRRPQRGDLGGGHLLLGGRRRRPRVGRVGRRRLAARLAAAQRERRLRRGARGRRRLERAP